MEQRARGNKKNARPSQATRPARVKRDAPHLGMCPSGPTTTQHATGNVLPDRNGHTQRPCNLRKATGVRGHCVIGGPYHSQRSLGWVRVQIELI